MQEKKEERAHRLPNWRKTVETPLSPIGSAASPVSRCPGGGDFRSNKVFNVSILRLSQLLQFPQFPNSLGPSSPSRPPGFSSVGAPNPSDPFGRPPPQEASEGCGVYRAPFPRPPRPQISAARARDRADQGSYLATALGLGAPQAGALQTGAHGPCVLAGSQRRGPGAEGKLGLRPG